MCTGLSAVCAWGSCVTQEIRRRAEGSEGGSSCCHRAGAGALCQLCALSAGLWRQWQCAAFMCQLDWRPWMLTVVVPGFAPLDWLPCSLPMCSEGLQCCRTAPWQWHCCLVRLLAGLYKSVWMDLLLDGKERMLGGQNGRLQQVVAASPQGSG